MEKIIQWIRRQSVLCALWIAICFTLTSGAWLSWEYHLLTMMEPVQSDITTMVFGYLMQAVGVGISGILQGRKVTIRPVLGAIAGCFIEFLFARMSQSVVAVIFCGMIMNVLMGLISGFYLLAAARTEGSVHGLVFGGGYAISIIALWLLSLPGKGSFLKNGAVAFVYLLLAVLAIYVAILLFRPETGETLRGIGMLLGRSGADGPGKPAEGAAMEGTESGDAESPGEKVKRVHFFSQDPETLSLWMLSLLVLCLISLVKNMGFSFPSADIGSGTSVEFSRIFYAIGLVIAGYVYMQDKKYGAICAVSSLVIPFVMFAMAGENVIHLVLWGIDYLFFGFVSVYRVALTIDLAKQKKVMAFAPLGLAAGRVGDALGTAICIGLSGRTMVLIFLTLGLFLLTLFLFFRLFLLLYYPQKAQERSEKEIFEEFSIRHDLSSREKDVLRLLLAEKTNVEIAEALFVSESTIKFHVHNLLQKTECKSRRELVQRFQTILYPKIGK